VIDAIQHPPKYGNYLTVDRNPRFARTNTNDNTPGIIHGDRQAMCGYSSCRRAAGAGNMSRY
jgi:hypothetical protein